MLDDLVIKDALRYLGAKGADEEAHAALYKVYEKHSDVFLPRFIAACYPLEDFFPELIFEGTEIRLEGESIRHHFAGATEGLFSAFTLGIAFDKRVRELSLTHPSESVALNALGSAYAERKADELLRTLRDEKEAQGFKTNFRFCPGYGDLPLSANAAIARALDAAKKIGLTVTEEGLLLPIKSIVGVTACVPIL